MKLARRCLDYRISTNLALTPDACEVCEEADAKTSREACLAHLKADREWWPKRRALERAEQFDWECRL